MNASMKKMVAEKAEHETRVRKLEAHSTDADEKLQNVQAELAEVVEELKKLNQTLAAVAVGGTVEKEHMGLTPADTDRPEGRKDDEEGGQAVDVKTDGDVDEDPMQTTDIEEVIVTPNVSIGEPDSICPAPVKVKV